MAAVLLIVGSKRGCIRVCTMRQGVLHEQQAVVDETYAHQVVKLEGRKRRVKAEGRVTAARLKDYVGLAELEQA